MLRNTCHPRDHNVHMHLAHISLKAATILGLLCRKIVPDIRAARASEQSLGQQKRGLT